MASFPTSVKTFTTKNPGEVVQSAHINDIQDEVNAIEAGFINGTAPLNSSRATPVSLSVSGGSTLASLTVSGGSTFAVRPVTPPPHAVRVFLASTVSASSNLSTLAFLSQSYLTNSSMHSTALNPERMTPQSTGIYMITAQVSASSNSTGFRQIVIRDSSAELLGRAVEYANVGSSDVGAFLQASAFKRFDALGGYVVCELQNVAASTLSLEANETWFAMHKL